MNVTKLLDIEPQTISNIAFTKTQHKELLRALKSRFDKNMNRYKALEWTNVQAKLEANTEKLWSINEMEKTGGEREGAIPATPLWPVSA